MTVTVTGHVTCSDTQQPARFAMVTLISAETAQETRGRGGFSFGGRTAGRTDLNGNFTMQAEPGDYYATATATGYASPVAEAAARLGASATSADLLAQLPEVHVGEGGAGQVNLTLDRGGVISGKLQWEDGSPAAGVTVIALQSTATTTGQTQMTRVLAEFGGRLASSESDDRGVFRITGLAPGSYVVRATMATPAGEPSGGVFGERMTTISLYAPGKVRRSDAQTITLKSGEERDDVMFLFDLNVLHTVSGHASAADGGTVASGVVRLTDSQDDTLSRQAMIQPDGSFAIQWVPAGSYTLAVSNASSAPSLGFGGMRGQPTSSSAIRYQSAQETMTVTDSDVSGVTVSLTPVATASSQ
jgi:hypothetical protein